MSVALSRTCVALALVLGSGVALAESPTDNFPQIDTCIDAALQQQAGHVVGLEARPGQGAYRADGRRAGARMTGCGA